MWICPCLLLGTCGGWVSFLTKKVAGNLSFALEHGRGPVPSQEPMWGPWDFVVLYYSRLSLPPRETCLLYTSIFHSGQGFVWRLMVLRTGFAGKGLSLFYEEKSRGDFPSPNSIAAGQFPSGIYAIGSRKEAMWGP